MLIKGSCKTTKATFESINFLPDHYEEFLIKEVGFSRVDGLGTAKNESKGKRKHQRRSNSDRN